MVEKYKIFCKQQGEKFYFRRWNFGKNIQRAKLQAEKSWEKKSFQVYLPSLLQVFHDRE